MQLREVAAISGKPGLFHILKPTHGGVIVEALDDSRARQAVGASQRLSILSEISMYTTTSEGSEPLGQIFAAIYQKYEGKAVPFSAKSDGADLEDFFGQVLPDWDRDRVYLSDIKKLVSWYNILIAVAPEALQPAAETEATPETEEESSAKEAALALTAKKATEKPAVPKAPKAPAPAAQKAPVPKKPERKRP